MEVYQLIKRGEMHKDFCEDFLLSFTLDEQYSVYAVFDGCSTGKDSHLASSLIAKVVKAEMECLALEPIVSPKELITDTIYNVMSTLRNIRNDLFLETDELLSTLILMVVDTKKQLGGIRVFGDGFVSINGKLHTIEQDNRPDYLAYYLDELQEIEDFEIWLENHSEWFDVADIQDVSVATDGVDSFQRYSGINKNEEDEPKPMIYLSNDTYLINNKSMLARKCNILRTKYSYVNQDDIAMIRVVA